MTAPLVTCVMLCRWPERRAFITDALASYDTQDYPRRELVVVNDGRPICSTRDDVRVYNIARATVGTKRNVGAMVAGGGWIATWDDDDVSLPSRLGELVSLAEERDLVAVRCSLMAYSDAEMRVRGVVSGACYGTGLVRRAAWESVGCPDLNSLEDMELWLRMGLRGYPTDTTHTLLYVARRHDTNVTAALRGESLATYAARALPQHDAELAGVQAAVDRIRARRCGTILIEA